MTVPVNCHCIIIKLMCTHTHTASCLVDDPCSLLGLIIQLSAAIQLNEKRHENLAAGFFLPCQMFDCRSISCTVSVHVEQTSTYCLLFRAYYLW